MATRCEVPLRCLILWMNVEYSCAVAAHASTSAYMSNTLDARRVFERVSTRAMPFHLTNA